MHDEGSYICDNCGEEIIIPLDPTAGRQQDYIEDCPVCCSPVVIRIQLNSEGEFEVRAEAEQDRY